MLHVPRQIPQVSSQVLQGLITKPDGKVVGQLIETDQLARVC